MARSAVFPVDPPPPVLPVHKVTSEVKDPFALAAVGNQVWALNGDSTISVLDATCWCVVRRIKDKSFGLRRPNAIVADGSHVWVANGKTSTLSEFDQADGSFIRLVEGKAYGFSEPIAMASDGKNLWVVNEQIYRQGKAIGTDSVTEINESDASLVRRLKGKPYGFNSPVSIAISGTKAWVSNEGSGTITEVSVVDGSFSRTLGGLRQLGVGFQPGALAYEAPADAQSPGMLWVADDWGMDYQSGASANGVVLFDTSTGMPTFRVPQPQHRFGTPTALFISNMTLWIAGTSDPWGYPDSLSAIDLHELQYQYTLKAKRYGLAMPLDVLALNGNVWVANANGGISVVTPA